jgi:acyl carrier protein
MQVPRFSRALLPEAIAETVRAVIARTSGRSVRSDADDLTKDLSFDETDRIELMMAVELALGIVISEEEAEDLDTVGDLIASAVDKSLSKHMPVRPKIDNGGTAALRNAIQDLAIGAAKAGRTIDLSAAPEVLKSHHFTADLPIEEIVVDLQAHAKRTGAKTSLGRWRD